MRLGTCQSHCRGLPRRGALRGELGVGRRKEAVRLEKDEAPREPDEARREAGWGP